MAGDRSRYGLSMSALGAIALAVSVFLPWYRVSSIAHTSLGTSAGRSLSTLSAQQAIPGMKVLLLVLAGLAMLDALLPLVSTAAPVSGGAGGSVALLGAAAAACALFRIIDPPAVSANVVVLSLREGPWLALLASLTMVVGGTWPRRVDSAAPSDARVHGAWRGVSG